MLSALLAVSLAAWLSTPQSMPEARPITVSAAVSLSAALTAIAEEYGRLGRGTVRFNFGGSNTLARQIVNGARVDIFVSADDAQMDVVAAAGLLKDGTRIPLLRNQLAVVVPSDRPRTFKSLKEIADPAFKRIALGDPAAVPAGVYAKQYLEKEGLWRAIEPRVVPTSSVRAALTAVTSGAADAAIVYRTDARSAAGATVAWVVAADVGPRVVYPGAIIRDAATPEAQRFLDFLRGESATRIFERFGFQTASANSPAKPPGKPSERQRTSHAIRLRRVAASAGQGRAGDRAPRARERNGAARARPRNGASQPGCRGPRRSREVVGGSGRLRAVGASASLAGALAEAGGAKPPG